MKYRKTETGRYIRVEDTGYTIIDPSTIRLVRTEILMEYILPQLEDDYPLESSPEEFLLALQELIASEQKIAEEIENEIIKS